MKNVALGLILAAGLAAPALASTSSATVIGTASFTNIASMNSLNDAANISAVWTGSGAGMVNAIRVTGNLTDGGLGTYASEARVRVTPGAGNSFAAFNLGATTATQTYTTLPIGPVDFNVPTPFALAAGDVNFQWYESYNDGAGADQTWDDVSYQFLSNTITNGGASLGALPSDGSTYNHAGSHVAGGLDFFTFSIGGVSSPSDYLNIRMNFGAEGGMTDTEIALYDSLGNLVFVNDDIISGTWSSQFSFGAADPLAGPAVPGVDGATLPAGSYTLVTAGYDTVWGATLGEIVPGSNAGTYDLSVTYSVPTPGAMALLGLSGLVAVRRRR